jgi:hypothetical protein
MSSPNLVGQKRNKLKGKGHSEIGDTLGRRLQASFRPIFEFAWSARANSGGSRQVAENSGCRRGC